MIALLALRFGIPALIRKDTLGELEFFPPVQGLERIALRVYFVTNTYLIFSPFLTRIQTGSRLFTFGWIIYSLGFVVMALSLTEFSKSNGIWLKGIYQFSRNPMYVGYFLIFIGKAVLIGSWFHLALTFIYQIAVHFLVLSEERWCLDNYGETYKNYQEKVPRYI
jgi:protein-S-isoprenylcysteine O-methyltransferase Ste14